MSTLRSQLAWALLVSSVLCGPSLAEDARTLASQVQIRRTQFGVPHLLAPTLEAATFGFGYCQAEDHAQDILRGIIATRGESAEAFGGARNAEADFSARQFRVYPLTLENYSKLDPDYRTAVEGFVAGFNYYLEKHRGQMPAWAHPITCYDLAAYNMAGIRRFAFNRSNLIRSFLRAQGVRDNTAQLDANEDGELGSNMWAFAPNRTTSGHAILMGNPHQAWEPVSTYYEAHMTVPGKLNFYGSVFIGGPIFRTGFNEYLGWSHTVNYPDLEEIYELELDADRPDHYRFDGASLPLVRDDVTVRTAGPNGTSSETRTFWHAPLGPVIHRTANKVFVLRSACYDNFDAYGQWFKMTQTKNLEEFRKAVEINRLPMFNICYADREGSIFYLFNGTVPNLPHPAHSAAAVPASRTRDIWTTFHTTSELPQLLNPPGGYVQNSNSPPFFTNLSSPLKPEDFPPHLRANGVSLRTQHSLQLVANDKKFSLEQVVELKHDQRLVLADRVKDELIAAVRASQPSLEVELAASVLEKWDNTTWAESRGGVLFAAWWTKYIAGGFRGFAEPWSPAEPMTTPRKLADTKRAATTFSEAVKETTAQYGRVDVAWGDAHRIRKGTTDRVDLPVSGGAGDMGAFRVLDFRRDADGKQSVRGGDGWVFAVEFSTPPRAYSVVGYSASNVEHTPHFKDQAPLFSANKMKPVAFTEAEIAAQLIKSYHPGEE